VNPEAKEQSVPHVIVKLWPGKSEQQKARLSEEIVKDVMDIMKDMKDIHERPADWSTWSA
jgi:hypothetical protein